jgi:hypothetical protein
LPASDDAVIEYPFASVQESGPLADGEARRTGLGPVVAAGWLAATAVGAAAGAATGGIVGALTEAGVSADDAHSYAEGVRRGDALVSARVADTDKSRLDSVLNESAVDLRDRSAAWQKAGWKSFDPASKPYGAEEVRKERQLYGGALR